MESSGVKQVLTMLKRLSFKWFVTCYLTPSQLCRLCEQNILREKISSSIFVFLFVLFFVFFFNTSTIHHSVCCINFVHSEYENMLRIHLRVCCVNFVHSEYEHSVKNISVCLLHQFCAYVY